MPEITVTFLNEGKPFRPPVLVEDVEDYEAAEEKAAKTGKPSALLRARKAWIEKILTKTPDYKGGDLKLEASQVTEAFWAIWKATALGKAPDPLE